MEVKKLIKIELPRVSDLVALKKYCKRSELTPWKVRLNDAYIAYLQANGDASVLTAISLDSNAISRMESCYRDETIKDGLDWLIALRDARNLSACPMCGGFSKGTLEHILPKINFPEFYIFSANLVPSCQICNGKRLNTASAAGLLHPYFDEILSNPILSTIIVPPFMAPKFTPMISLPSGTDEATALRAKNHVARSIKESEYESYARGRWHFAGCRAKRFNTLQSFADEITGIGEDYERSNGLNNWEGAFWRGLNVAADAKKWLFTNKHLF